MCKFIPNKYHINKYVQSFKFSNQFSYMVTNEVMFHVKHYYCFRYIIYLSASVTLQQKNVFLVLIVVVV